MTGTIPDYPEKFHIGGGMISDHAGYRMFVRKAQGGGYVCRFAPIELDGSAGGSGPVAPTKVLAMVAAVQQIERLVAERKEQA